jgi:hypothetical protein
MGLRGVQLGLDLRNEGMARVIDHDLTWAGLAAAMFPKLFTRGEEVTGEDIRLRLIEAGLPTPPHENAWGAVTHALARNDFLHDTGRVKKATDPRSHARRLVIWRVL